MVERRSEQDHQHAQKEQPAFTDQQLSYIVNLAKQDGLLATFIETMDNRAQTDVGRTVIVSAIAYRAVEMLAWRKARKDAVDAELQESIKRRLAKDAEDAKRTTAPKAVEPPPRIPVDSEPATIAAEKVNGHPESGA